MKEGSTRDPDNVDTSFDGGKSMIRSESQRPSLRRSISRGSSIGRSSSRSLPISFGLPVTMGIQELDPIRDGGQQGSVEHVEPQQEVSLTRLAYLNKPELPILLLGCIAAAIHGAIFPVFGLLFSNTIHILYESRHELRKDASFWALIYLGLGVVGVVAIPFQHYLFGIAGAKLIQRIRSMSFARIVHQEISWFDEPQNSSGAIGARLSGGASTMRSLVGDSLALNVQNITTIIAGIVIAFIGNWILAFIVMSIMPLLLLQGYIQVKFLRSGEDAKVMYEDASKVANDAVSSIRTVASFSAEQKVMDAYQQNCEAPMKYGVRQGFVTGMGFGFSNFVVFCSYAICFYAGARLVEDGKTTFNHVFKVFFALSMAATGVTQSNSMSQDTSKAKDSAASIFSILDRKSKIDPSDASGTVLSTVKGDIEFQNVSFKYPTRPNVQIFRNLCLTIPSKKVGNLPTPKVLHDR